MSEIALSWADPVWTELLIALGVERPTFVRKAVLTIEVGQPVVLDIERFLDDFDNDRVESLRIVVGEIGMRAATRKKAEP